jgi:hypothetical protein
MKQLFRLVALSGAGLLGASATQAQQANRFTISGYVRDGATGKNLPGVASNVRRGYGLFGGATDVTYRIQIP